MSEDKLTRLIILGAGASVDCGFYPTGAQFLEVVRRILEIKKGSADFSEPSFRYMENLLRSNHLSIDAHISYICNKEEKEFLKALIASIILASTSYSLLRGKFENSWYRELVRLIFPTVSEEEEDEDRLKKIEENLKFLQIVTFNYDASLELYIAERAKNFFKNSDDDILQKFLQKLLPKIYHVYGGFFANEFEIIDVLNGGKEQQTGQWISECKLNFSRAASSHTEYHPLSSFCEFLDKTQWRVVGKFYVDSLLGNIFAFAEQMKGGEIANRIKIINEDRGKNSEAKNEDLELDKILQQEDGWDVLYVLGYGFDPLNNERLKVKKLKWNKGCFVTNFDGTQKMSRTIWQELVRKKSIDAKDRQIWQIPTEVSPENISVRKALDEYFGLHENPSVSSEARIAQGLDPWQTIEREKI